MIEKVETDYKITVCPKCFHEPELQRNTGYRFRVKCPNCKEGTQWGSKTEALLRWAEFCTHDLRNQVSSLEYQVYFYKRVNEELQKQLNLYKY